MRRASHHPPAHQQRHRRYQRQTAHRDLWASIAESVADWDRRWFEMHPGATMRVRTYVRGELPGLDLQEHWMLVTQVRPGVRMRATLAAYPPDTIFMVDEATGEVVRKFSDHPIEPDELLKVVREVTDADHHRQGD